jgi:hypothetical protein
MHRLIEHRGMTLQPPKFPPTDPRHSRETRDAFQLAVRDLVVKAVSAGWREAEAAIALADAADDYVMFLSERPRRNPVAANSN